jgi:rubrerythrin
MIENQRTVQILSRALKLELYSHRFFYLLENRAHDEECRDILKRLAIEERAHSTFLMSELELLGEKPTDEINAEAEHAFDRGISVLAGEGPVSVFDHAILFKQKIIDFYRESLKSMSDARIEKILSKFIDMEEKHKRILNMSLVIAQAKYSGPIMTA